MWEIMFCVIYVTVIVFIPFATFYYESDSTDLVDVNLKKSRFLPALLFEIPVLLFFVILLVALYFSGKANTNIPVTDHSYPLYKLSTYDYSYPNAITPQHDYSVDLPSGVFSYNSPIAQSYYINWRTYKSSSQKIIYPVGFGVFLIGLFGWMGWWLYSIFVGVGLAAFPFDFIIAYIWRPKVLAPDEMAMILVELQERTNEILEVTTLLKKDRYKSNKSESRKRYLSDRVEVNRLTQMVFLIERDLEEFQACKDVRKGYYIFNKIICLLFINYYCLFYRL